MHFRDLATRHIGKTFLNHEKQAKKGIEEPHTPMMQAQYKQLERSRWCYNELNSGKQSTCGLIWPTGPMLSRTGKAIILYALSVLIQRKSNIKHFLAMPTKVRIK